LTRQQWQTLAMGLSWHRAGRSISVRAWLNKMHTERGAMPHVPGVRGLQTAPVNHGTSASLRATTMFVVLLMTVSVWVSFVRWASGSKATGDDVVPAMVANPSNQSSQPDQQSGEVSPAASEDGSPANSGARNAPPSTALSQPPEGTPKLSNNRGHEASRPKQSPASDRPLLVSPGNYTVQSGERFAEIRVHRSSLLPSDTAFVWWTEAASAKPGIDYVHQGKVMQAFPKGKNSTSFFVKLVPRVSRARREVFYIAIAEAGRNASADPVARAAVWLPMNQDHAQAAAEHDAHTESGAHVESDTQRDSRFSTAALGSPLAGSK
jgi:hypothetical protein